MLAHLRPYWWAYAVSSLLVVAGAILLAIWKPDLHPFPFGGSWAIVLAPAVLVQCVAFMVVYRRPSQDAERGEPSVSGSVLRGIGLFALIITPVGAGLSAFSCLLAPIGWFFILPIGLLASTYRDVMTD